MQPDRPCGRLGETVRCMCARRARPADCWLRAGGLPTWGGGRIAGMNGKFRGETQGRAERGPWGLWKGPGRPESLAT